MNLQASRIKAQLWLHLPLLRAQGTVAPSHCGPHPPLAPPAGDSSPGRGKAPAKWPNRQEGIAVRRGGAARGAAHGSGPSTTSDATEPVTDGARLGLGLGLTAARAAPRGPGAAARPLRGLRTGRYLRLRPPDLLDCLLLYRRDPFLLDHAADAALLRRADRRDHVAPAEYVLHLAVDVPVDPL